MITAIFNPDTTMANAYGLWQWDYGQILRIQGLHLPSMVEIHFSLQETGGTSASRVGVTKDGVTDVIIPDSMLENDGATKDYDMFAFVYLTDATSGQTEYKINLQVESRPKPEVFGGGENPNIFHEAVQAVQKSADKAAESEKQAEGWAHGREDLPERAQDNAKYYAGQAAADAKKTGTDRKEVERLVESVSGIDEQVTKVENLTKQAQTSATNAALSEQAAKTAETNAQTAQAGAETAEGNAELAERNAKASEQAVEKAKQLVTQMGQEVLDNKNHVDQTAQAFDQTAQQAVADVNNAGQTQTERVQSAGNTAVESVKAAQTAATKAVETAKAEAVKAVQTEGTTQTGNVTAEGAKQVQAVQQAAQEIVADREQIAQNKADVTALKEDIDKLSSDDAIKSNMIDGQISHRQTTFIPYEKIENSVITNSGTQSSVIECDNTQLINLEKYPSAIKVFNIYQGVNWGAVVGKKKDGTFAGWKYSSLPSTFCTKYDNYVEINIDYLRSSGLWESLGFNMSHGSDLRMEYDTEILADKKKLEWLIIPHRFIVDKNGHGDYVTIQDAVNNANNGDEIIVFEGEYEEAVDLGTKALHLHGLNASNTIIWNDTGAYDTPPIEVGHGLIENLTFYSKKDSNKDYSEITRKSYAVHLDQRWGNGTKSVVFKNCVFIGEHTTPIGCGVIDDVNIELYDCIADATTLNNGNAFQIHGSSTGTGNANIILNGCTFKKGSIGNGNGILLSNGGAAYNKGTTITIKANNCYGSFYNNAGDLLILDSSSFGNSDSKLNN